MRRSACIDKPKRIDHPESLQEEVRGSFNKTANAYADFYRGRTRISHFFNARKRLVEELLADVVVPGSAVLEVGCGPGIMVDYFLQRNAVYHGLDLSTEMIAMCRAKFQTIDSARFLIGDVQRLVFQDKCFDLVLCLGVLEYVPAEARALREVARVLKPGGTFLFSSINKWSPFNTWDRLVYRKATRKGPGPIVREFHTMSYYRRLLPACGFTILSAAYYDFSLIGRPFDAMIPRLASGLSERLERLRTSKLRGLGNGFVIRCQVT